MNFLHLAGHLGADPEIRYTSNGKKITALRLATRVRKGNTDETLWWRVTIWGEQFDYMIPYLKKGSPIIVMGEMSKPEIYTDRNGQPQISLNITANNVSFSPFGRGDKAQEATSTPSKAGTQEGEAALEAMNMAETTPMAKNATNQGIDDDEVPF